MLGTGGKAVGSRNAGGGGSANDHVLDTGGDFVVGLER